jgi:ankyrin repeat protein
MRYKADINVKNDRGTTPLMKAAQIGHLFALKLIAAEGAKINAINNYGNTALHEAVYNNRYECLQYLLEINADTTIKNIRNLTPLEVAKKKKDQKSIQILETAAKRRHG